MNQSLENSGRSAASKGKSLFNILPLKNHQSISSIMPFYENDSELKNYQIVFATAQGKVRKIVLKTFHLLIHQEK